MRCWFFSSTLIALISLVAVPCQAGTFLSTLVPDGSINTYEDQSRETWVDVDGSGGLTNGDVRFGWMRLDGRISPSPGAALSGTSGYIAFSQQIENTVRTDFGAAVGYTFNFRDTIVPGLTFSALTGTAVAPGTVGILVEDIGVDLVSTSPGDLNGNALLDNGDFLRHIAATGTKLLEFGETQPTGANKPPEFQFASSFNFKASGVPNDVFGLLDGITLGSPHGHGLRHWPIDFN